MRSQASLIFALCACAAVVSCGEKTASSPSIPTDRLDAVARDFNRGIALMERFQPEQAVLAFEAVVGQAPGWVPGHFNLGIALLNVGEDVAIAQAEKELRWVVEQEPKNPYALYSLGVLLRHNENGDEAKNLFERALAIDPEDPDVNYQLGILAQDNAPDQARAYLERTLEHMPHHQSACYRLAALLRKSGEPERATELLNRFRTLKDANAGFEAGMKYGEMGRYAAVIRKFDAPSSLLDAQQVPTFTDVAETSGLTQPAGGQPGWANSVSFGPGVAVADVDGDRDLDVYLPGCGPNGAGVLYLNQNGNLSEVGNSGIDGNGAVGAFFGDYDKDGDPDLFLTRSGADRLYQNQVGRFVDVTASCGVGGGDWLSVGAVWADADHDNDLDLFVARYGSARGEPGAPNSLWRNNGDGTFVDVASGTELAAPTQPTLGAAFVDLDSDRDLDLLILHHGADNQIFLNDRMGIYRPANSSYPELAAAGNTYGVISGDLDRNGKEDLLLLHGQAPPSLHLHTESGDFDANSDLASSLQAFAGAGGAMMGDYDLDGNLDVVLLDAAQEGGVAHTLLMTDGGGGFYSPITIGEVSSQPTSRGAVSADLNDDGTLELLINRVGHTPQLWSAPPLPGRHWLKILATEQQSENGTWAEPTAVGMKVEVKTGLHTQVRRMASTSGYLGSAPRRLHFGLGQTEVADYVRLSWMDAVLQSELEVAGGELWQIKKIKRKPSSCPILFSWDGERFAYITDFLGVGGMGFFVEPGVYAPPDPTEDVRIPPELIAETNGRYLLRVAEPLEEVTYLDQLYLQVYDHPSDWEIYPDERFTGSAPFPTGKPYAVAEPIFPQSAQTDRGVDLLDTLSKVDRKYAEPPIDSRFVGYARDHWIEIDFGNRLADVDRSKPLILYLYGWVEYTYSHVNYAAWQAGIVMRSPWIELPDGKGGWKAASPEMGFPAGLPRMMTVDISDLPLDQDGRLRIRTNMEVFWDQIYAAVDVSEQTLIQHNLHPIVADLHALGYPREFSPDGANPTVYDYHRLDLGVPFKNMQGQFTDHGDVRQLLRKVDDQFVILARGEEVALEFDASSLPPLPKNWSRTLILHSDGYCKDMDLYTAFPDTVEPLPYHGMANYPPQSPLSPPVQNHE